jgi:hypothetical protein
MPRFRVLKGSGSAIGVENDARYLPTDIAVNVANGPGRAFEIAQWLGVAGQALEHPDSPATAMLGIPAAGLAARYGLKGLGRLADSSIDPLDATRTSAVGDMATDAAAPTDRYYHGGTSDFARPDPEKFGKEGGLFGDNAFYVTNEPRVAGGVIGPASEDTVANITHNIAMTRQDLERVSAPDWNPTPPQRGTKEDWIKYTQKELMRLEQQLQDVQAPGHVRQAGYAQARYDKEVPPDLLSGPNVRPVDVPRDLRLLDADTPVPADEAASIQRAIAGDMLTRPTTEPMTVQDLGDFAEIVNGTGGKDELNKVLSQMGYDGISYAGGNIRPMYDDAGRPIQHRALALFPESLDKIRNATAGTPGGIYSR